MTVNGIAAPLFFASPTQINFQMPGSSPASAIQVVVNNQATVKHSCHASVAAAFLSVNGCRSGAIRDHRQSGGLTQRRFVTAYGGRHPFRPEVP